ncbi:nitroreductase family protein [Mangrovibacterium diazotrophicum]|uniref:Nitroreductase n=1 Tax=Mangrovibacterium diazotrophicum TaxID=1261403 RepID=A0A419VVH2_9BACT|nr:nitroreductase family protein [Mangrovibacterium diazotrophicum]RKD86012.1 nitroreductase [Mangrovibacterium diazotrophicum]
MLRDLILRNRSYRRFDESARITADQLTDWIELARFSASGRNAQPLKYIPLFQQEDCDRLFPHLGWAGYLKDWKGPESGERPSAYIIIVNDTEIATNYFCDDGIAAQSILLGAVEAGYGGCMIASVNKKAVQQEFRIPERYQLLMVIALGKPVEEVVLEEMKDGDFKYWRDEEGVHHVPKRSLDELILKL